MSRRDFMAGLTGSYGNVRTVETLNAVEKVEDWSKVRSPGRARRRLKRGFPQRISTFLKPAAYMVRGVLYIHPEMMRDLERVAQRNDAATYGLMGASVFGP